MNTPCCRICKKRNKSSNRSDPVPVSLCLSLSLNFSPADLYLSLHKNDSGAPKLTTPEDREAHDARGARRDRT